MTAVLDAPADPSRDRGGTRRAVRRDRSRTHPHRPPRPAPPRRADFDRVRRETGKLFELLDGTLVEKAMSGVRVDRGDETRCRAGPLRRGAESGVRAGGGRVHPPDRQRIDLPRGCGPRTCRSSGRRHFPRRPVPADRLPDARPGLGGRSPQPGKHAGGDGREAGEFLRRRHGAGVGHRPAVRNRRGVRRPGRRGRDPRGRHTGGGGGAARISGGVGVRCSPRAAVLSSGGFPPPRHESRSRLRPPCETRRRDAAATGSARPASPRGR